MSDKTHIEWTDATWNPVTGCTKVSSGCKHCYAERDWARLSANPKTRYYNRAFTDVQCHDDVLPLPLRWARRRRIFVNSMADLFHDAVPDDFIDEVFAVMARAKRHTFQVLTKRPERMRAYLSDISLEDRLSDIWREKMWLEEGRTLMLPLSNVWLGVSVEDQATADERIPLLLQAPAAVRWISAEPLLEAVHLRKAINPAHIEGNVALPGLDWVIVGGESGPNARPMHPDWARSLRDQCAAAGAPFLLKQWGEHWPAVLDRKVYEIEPWRITPNGVRAWNFTESLKPADTWPTVIMMRVGKKVAGRLLDGIEHNGYPS